MLKSVREQKQNMEDLINSEVIRSEEISRMDGAIHEHIKDYMFENPTASTSSVLREVKSYLKKEGFNAPHADVSYQSFTDFERIIAEEMETVKETTKESVSFER